MNFAQWSILPDVEKLVVFEARVAKELEFDTWTATGSGSYWVTFDPAARGEVVAVNVNGTAYVRAASVVACDGTTSSFYPDLAAGRLYIHMAAGDSPANKTGGAYDYCVLAYFWIGIVNAQPEDAPVFFTPQDATKPIQYLPYLASSSIPQITQTIGDYYSGTIQIQFGSIKFNNDGWFYTAFADWIWDNKICYLKVGVKGSAYSDLVTIFPGKMRNRIVGDDDVEIDVTDRRLGKFGQIPFDRYYTADYPNLENGQGGQPIPILFGLVAGIKPVCVDSATHRYKIAGHAIESIEAVYSNGTPLTVTTNYTANLPAGEFTLTYDPKSELITCDAKGLKHGTGGVFSQNVADHLYYVLVTLCGFAVAEIDAVSFAALKAGRTQNVNWYLQTATNVVDVIRMLQTTSVFQHIPTLDGKQGAYIFVAGVTGSEPRFYSEDLDSFGITYQTDSIYYRVVVKYAYVPSTGVWLSTEKSEEKVLYRYEEAQTLELETALSSEVEAVALAALMLDMVKTPPEKVAARVTPAALTIMPADKAIFSKVIRTGQGDVLTVLDSALFRFLEIRKDGESLKSDIVAWNDVQSYGGYHGDAAHQDYTHNDHLDGSHSDVAHSDEWDYGHADSPYYDVDHTDVAHEDIEHEDITQINHFDIPNPHEDGGYEDVHGDVSHANVAHEDVVHGDTYIDQPYLDTLYQDYDYIDHSDTSHVHHDGGYTDVHGNKAHTDEAHGDAVYEDVYHVDVDHADSSHDDYSDFPHDDSLHGDHTDYTHANVPHSDSEF